MQYIPQEIARLVTNGRYWSHADDQILILLREDTPANLSLADIAKGMFGRSRSGVAGRLTKLRRKHRVM